jgi:recombination protein RecR
MHDAISKLAEVFVQFPGIGKRQAKRFVYFLLAQDASFREDLAKLIRELQNDIASCVQCHRFFVGRKTQSDVCDICSDPARDKTALMIVEKDVDLENIESSGAYNGRYFVLGGTVPVLDEAPEHRVRAKELQERIESDTPKEIILATSAHPEGENTAEYVRTLLAPFQEKHSFSLSLLGRGLSTGTELEYSDADTIKNAFENRSTT